jgi:hypothetical protein
MKETQSGRTPFTAEGGCGKTTGGGYKDASALNFSAITGLIKVFSDKSGLFESI